MPLPVEDHYLGKIEWRDTFEASHIDPELVWARAMDSRGFMQPHVAPNWNPSGYGGNPMHRIAVLIG